MVRIRLTRRGSKGNPAYRVVVANQTSPRDGRFIEILGHYQPTQTPEVLELKVLTRSTRITDRLPSGSSTVTSPMLSNRSGKSVSGFRKASP